MKKHRARGANRNIEKIRAGGDDDFFLLRATSHTWDANPFDASCKYEFWAVFKRIPFSVISYPSPRPSSGCGSPLGVGSPDGRTPRSKEELCFCTSGDDDGGADVGDDGAMSHYFQWISLLNPC